MHIRRSLLACVLLGAAVLLLFAATFFFSLNPAPRNWQDSTPKPPPVAPVSTLNISGSQGRQLLALRLKGLLASPPRSFADSLNLNSQSCPPELHDRLVNPDQLANERRKWRQINKIEILARRGAMVKYLETLENSGIEIIGGENTGEGRGIVMTGGNKDTVQRILVTLRMLRNHYNSTLPVEVFAFPGEITDLHMLAQLKELDAKVIELEHAIKLDSWKNFQIKAQSIISSSFAEVLYLDSDNIPLRDPAALFDAPLYYQKGMRAVFWPDLNKDHPENAIWRLVGKPCDSSEWEIDSGQILISKRGNDGRNLAALHLAAHMQANHEFYFALSGGDKDTFRYAFWVLGLPYATSPRWLSSLGFYSPHNNGRFCGHTMLQYDIMLSDSSTHLLPLFAHANLLKHLALYPSTGGPFQVIRRASPDIASDPSLNAVHMWVYHNAGMCVDVEIAGQGKDIEVVDENWAEAYDGAFANFGEIWAKEGGLTGGW